MQVVPLSAIPNQQFSIVLDGNTWEMGIHAANGIMAVTLDRNGERIIENLRAVAGMRIIPSRYEEAGNFLFLTQNYELPDYAKFGASQTLVYIGVSELAALRTPPKPPITASSFNPIADLPLRFAPKGYS